MNRIDGGVTAPQGFQAAGVFAGLKYKRKDMAMIYSEAPCEVAGVFTTNVVKAAPVLWNRQIVQSGKACHAVVINSGIANACTGEEGRQYCRETAEETEQALGCEEGSVLVCSTGVIGKQLPMDRIKKGVGMLTESLGGGREDARTAAQAILTTDTHAKEIAVEFTVEGKTVRMGGMCKGSGMIHPNMSTMLCFLTTDCAISKEMLQKALSDDVVDTFNMISIDGDTSTNDTVLILANGQSGIPVITGEGEEYDAFCRALHEVMVYLCRQIAGDGEGSSTLFEVQVIHAETKEQARILSKSVVSSNLTKAAVFGHDANWGRIICAMGYAGTPFDPDRTDVYFESEGGRIQVVKDGMEADYSEDEATDILTYPEVKAIADLKAGEESATAWGCDLTYDYVRINADYRS